MRKNTIITKKFTYLDEREPKVILKRVKSKHSGGRIKRTEEQIRKAKKNK